MLLMWSVGFLISMLSGSEAPRTIVAWPAGPLEVRVAVEGPLDESGVKNLPGRRITFGSDVAVGVVAREGSLAIAGARMDADGRTLVLATDPHPWNTRYTLPEPFGGVTYDLNGVEAAWEGDDATTIWWPSLILDEVRERTGGSWNHERFVESLGREGTLTLRTYLALPEGRATLRFEAGGPLRLEASTLDGLDGALDGDGRRLTFEAEVGELAAELFLVVRTGGEGRASLSATVELPGKSPRGLTAAELLLPWAPASRTEASEPAALPERLAGGDAGRGRTVFLAEESKCATCHRAEDQGGAVGPAAANFRSHEPAWLAREINEPSATIHPDYVPYTISLRDGRVLAGIVRSEGSEQLSVTDTAAMVTRIGRDEVEEIRPSATSIMPVGLAGVLGEERLRDLIAYLAGLR